MRPPSFSLRSTSLMGRNTAMPGRRSVSLFLVLLCAIAIPSRLEVLFAREQSPRTTSVCHDGVWDDGEYCGRDAYVNTLFPEMNHDCLIDGLDVGLFLNE